MCACVGHVALPCANTDYTGDQVSVGWSGFPVSLLMHISYVSSSGTNHSQYVHFAMHTAYICTYICTYRYKYTPQDKQGLFLHEDLHVCLFVANYISCYICSVFDVGGQRGERRKWIHCFNGLFTCVFVADKHSLS